MHIKVQAEIEEFLRTTLSLDTEGQRITRWEVRDQKDVEALCKIMAQGLRSDSVLTVLIVDRDRPNHTVDP
jgi:hypothetical protein